MCLRSEHLLCERITPPQLAVTGLTVCGAAATGSTAGDRPSRDQAAQPVAFCLWVDSDNHQPDHPAHVR